MYKFFSNNWLILGIIILATFFSYFNILSFDFVFWDDDKQILNNIYVKILTWEHIKHNLFFERFTFIPLTFYSIIYKIFGNSSYVFHLGSILLHLLNIWSVYKLLKKLNLTDFVVLGSTLIFALHPLRIESVAWISEWKDLLFTFFFIWGLYFYVSFLKKKRFFFLFIYIFMAWFAGFSKIQGILLPLSCILIDYFINHRFRINAFIFHLTVFSWVLLSVYFKIWFSLLYLMLIFIIYRNLSLREKLSIIFRPWILVTVLSVLLFFAFYYKWIWFWTNSGTFSFTDRVVFSGYSLFFYIQQFFFPIKQIAIHQYPIFTGIELWKSWGGYVLTLFLVSIIIYILFKSTIRNKHQIIFGLLFFILNISIVLHIIPIEGRLIVAERYTYLAYLGLIITVVSIAEFLLVNKALMKHIVFIIILTLFSTLTFQRTTVWRNTETLFKDVVMKEPTTSFAWVNLGSYYLEKKEYSKSLICYEKAKLYNPNDVQIYLNQSLSNMALKNISIALKNIEDGLRRSSINEDISMFLVTKGQIYEQQGDFKTAFILYNKALHTYNNNFKALLQKSMLYANDKSIQNIDSAIYYARQAIAINPYYADAYHTLGWLYLIKNNVSFAIINIKKSIELNPMSPFPYNTLGYIYMLQKKNDSALECYTRAILLDSSLVEVIKNRAWLYYQNKQFYQALSDYNRVLMLAPNDYVALVNAAFCNTYLKKYNDAIFQFKKIKGLFPDSLMNIYNLGWVFLQSGKADSAIVYYNIFLSKNSKFHQPLFERGYAYFLNKNYKKALNDFNQLKDLDSTNAEVYFWIGEVEYAMGNHISACVNYEIAKNKGFKQASKKIGKYCIKTLSLGN